MVPGTMGKEILGGKKNGSFPLQNAHTTRPRLSKDNQLSWKCSPEGGWDREKPCFLRFRAQSVSVVRSAGDS